MFEPKNIVVKGPTDLAGKSVGVTRGAIGDMELTRIAPSGVDIKRFADNNVTVIAFVSGQTTLQATGASVATSMMARTPNLSAEYKLVLKDSPNFIGVARGEDKLRLKNNEIIAAAKAVRDLDKVAQKWLGRPGAICQTNRRCKAAVILASFAFILALIAVILAKHGFRNVAHEPFQRVASPLDSRPPAENDA